MRILLLSKYFFPSVGGLEAIAWVCLREFVKKGHEVRLITESPGTIPDEANFSIFRNPSARELKKHLGWCEIVFHNDGAVRYLLPLWRSRKPYVVSMSGYIYAGSSGIADHISLRRSLLALGFRLLLKGAASNIAACPAVGAANQVPARIIPNPFDAAEFGSLPNIARTQDFLFAGRIVSLKGVDDLVRALAILNSAYQLRPKVTIAGPGVSATGRAETDYGAEILLLAEQLDVRSQILFTGALAKSELRLLMNSHRVFIIPSKWNEPIGIVSLEAISSGCVVIGTNGGGLATSIGPCGLTYSNGDHRALAKLMAEIIYGKIDLIQLRAGASDHLSLYQPDLICDAYLEVLHEALAKP